MITFRYKAINKAGNTVSGEIGANNAQDAKAQLKSQSLAVFELTERQASRRSVRLNTRNKMLLTRQLATLLSAGMTLEKSLQSITRQSQQANAKQLSAEILQKVSEGLSLSQALRRYPATFNATFCATVEAGETSGCLDTVLARLAEHEEQANSIRASIVQALIYPAILFVISTIMIGYLLVAVIPDVVKVFVRGEQKLPVITEYLLAVSTFVQVNWLWLIIGVFVAVIGLRLWLKQPAIRQGLHRFTLRLPVIGSLVREYNAGNYCSTLAVLLQSGVKLPDGMKIAARTLANTSIRQVADSAVDSVSKGLSAAKSLRSADNRFPTMMTELISVGEETGALPDMLMKTGMIYRAESRQKIATLTALLAPLMILMMGALIFAVVLAILLPIFDLNQAIQ